MTPTGASADALAQRMNGLVSRYTAQSAERLNQARNRQADASYLYGSAATFEIVATELWEALGKRGAVPQVAQAPHLSVLAEPPADGPSADGDPCPADNAGAVGDAGTG